MKIKFYVSKLIKAFFYLCSKFEAYIFNTGHDSKLIINKLYLRYMSVYFEKELYVAEPPYIYRRGGITFGSRVSLGEYTKFWNFNDIIIGDDFLGAAGLTITTGSHDILTLEPISKPTIIGSRVWVGVNTTILGGVTIGDDCVIAAGSVVKDSFPNGSIIGGVPAKLLKTIDRKKQKNIIWTPYS